MVGLCGRLDCLSPDFFVYQKWRYCPRYNSYRKPLSGLRPTDVWLEHWDAYISRQISATTYRAVISALFGRFSRVPLRLPLEREDSVL